MLQIYKIFKEYHTGGLNQIALDHVDLNLRDNEFVAILGPSGSGKTTLLNVLGGLDQYDDGDLIINGVSTKKYKDKDWDAYRNNTVGFVFQNYNLIPHQTVLQNVELALTLSGVSKAERTKRATEALEKVGLKEHIHKKPNQLSGGQMQRVAIARALVNDPDILLADEPTGALDSETSVQIMELLKDVAKDRLVVMVTHNPELAEDYATRIVSLKDGKIINDTNPLKITAENVKNTKYKELGKTFMSFATALNLSFNNLKTKKARTLLTAFAGSIGIIGIAMILSLSNGVNTYITDIQKETMTSYPVSIEAQSIDLSSIINRRSADSGNGLDLDHDLSGIYSNPFGLETASTMTTSISENNLTEFKKYLDDPNSEIQAYIGENGVVYSYDTKFDIYGVDPDGVRVKTDGSTLDDENTSDTTERQRSVGRALTSSIPGSSPGLSLMSGNTKDINAEELIPGQNGELVSTAITDQFEVLSGNWPQSGDEVVLVLNENNEISATTLYELGLLPSEQYKEVMKQIENGEEVNLDVVRWNYEDVIGRTYQVVPESDYYVENENGYYDYMADDESFVDDLLGSAQNITIVGVVKPTDEDAATLITEPIAYTQALTDYIIDHTNNSAVVQAQENNQDINILNGLSFAPADDDAKVEDATTYLSNLGISEKANMMRQILYSMGQTDIATTMNESTLAMYLDNFLLNPDRDALLSIYDTYISPGTYDDNLETFGVVSLDAPSSINIYADSFEDKDNISTAIQDYNATVSEENQITYTDFVGLLMSSVTTIINVITWVLVAFVAVALVVSSIMIGIITYISVLERTKEIGILRSIGASKGNISQVFNAETFIIGLISGLLGIGITLLLLIPTNIIIHNLMGTDEVNAALPFVSGIILIVLSVILTFIGGLIPSRKAANKDPVTALRTE